MKRWCVVIAATLVGVWLVVSTICEFFANEAIQYFSSAPYRLLYVVAIAVSGGVVALVFDRLSSRMKRNVKLFSWGGAASLLTMFWCALVYQTASLSGMIFIRNAGVGWMILVVLMSAALAAYLWFEFFRAWKTKVTQ